MSGGKDWDSIWGDDPRYQGSDAWQTMHEYFTTCLWVS